MNQELTKHILDRFVYLESFFDATSDRDRDNAFDTILQCGIDIRRAREKISDFCAKNDMQNPFDSSEHTSSQSNFSDDTPYLRTLSEIFALSKSERFLKQFLPEDTPEEESYLFYFSLDDSDVFDEASFEKQRFAVYEQIYERKLLIYFYASRQLQQKKEVAYFELRQKLSDLSFEIKACKKSVDAHSDEPEMSEESIAENDIARVEMLYNRVESLRRKYSAVQTGYDISQVFYTISQSLSLFIDTVGSRLSALETSEEQKEAILVSLRSTLHATLQRCWNQLGSSREEPIVAMRRILNEALEFLVHD